MPAESSITNFDAKLVTAKVEGIAGRRELLNKLARMPIDRIVSLPAKSLAILGPRGLAQLAAVREELAGASRKTDVKTSLGTPPSTTVRSQGGPRPIRSGVIVVVAILAAGLLIDMARPIFVTAFLESGIRPRDANRWGGVLPFGSAYRWLRLHDRQPGSDARPSRRIHGDPAVTADCGKP